MIDRDYLFVLESEEELPDPPARLPAPGPGDPGDVPVALTLARELHALRALLDRVVAATETAPDPIELVLPTTRLIEAISRTLRAHIAIAGSQDDTFHQTIDRILTEIGMGPEV